MTETLRYGLLGASDIRFGSGVFEVRLADGRVVTIPAVNLSHISGALHDGITVLQSGTGAVARTAAGKLGETVAVEDFGGGPTKTAAENKAAVEAALAKLDSGTRISGQIVFRTPGTTWALDGPIAIGDGAKAIDLVLEGITHWVSANQPRAPIVLSNPSGSADTFDVAIALGQTNSLVFRGLEIQHPAGATGRAIDLTTAIHGLVLEDMTFLDPGVGLYFGAGAVSPLLRNVTFYGCTTAGIELAASTITAGQLENVYFQSGEASGIVIAAGAIFGSSSFENCVFESNAGPDILLNGHLDGARFFGGHWEAPGAEMFRLVTGDLRDCSFYGTHFDGSSGAGGRHVVNNTAAGASSVFGRALVFSGCTFANLNGGRILSIATDPTNSNDPGYFDVTLLNCKGAFDLKGLHRANSQPARILTIIGGDQTAANILAGIGGIVPRYVLIRGDGVTVRAAKLTVDGPLIYTPITTFTASDTTPSVVAGTLFKTNNGSPTTITTFDDGVAGQEILLIFTDANTTIAETGNIKLSAAFTSSADDTMRLVFDGTSWFEVARSVN